MKRLKLYALFTILIALLATTIHSWGIFDYIDWDLVLYDNRIDPKKFRRYLGMAPKSNITLDKISLNVTKPHLVECLRNC